MEPLRPGDPRQIGSYRLLGRLGAGGMGQVFLGESPGHRKVAVKLVRAEHADDKLFRQRFTREVEAARKVGGFHTAQVVDADPDADPPWLVTAYIPGPSLYTQVRDHGPLDPEATRRLGAALAEGLAAIHACGLVHRDLKPGNIILAPDGPRIIDFGVARSPDASSLTSTGSLVGTVAFMSPEQVRGEHVDTRSDVFSLGGVLVYAATGRGPFDAETMAAMVYRIANKPPELGGIGGPVREVIASCLARDPAQRPSLSDLTVKFTDQDHDRAERPVVPAPPPPQLPPATQTQRYQPPPPTRTMPRRKAPTALVSLLAILGAAAAGIVFYYVGVNGENANRPGADGTTPSASLAARPPSSPSASPSDTGDSGSGNGGDVSSDYLGKWQGTLDDNTGLEGPQTASLTIDGGQTNSVVGQVSYPDVGCDYRDRLVSSDSGQLVLYEIVDTGPCVPEYAVLTPSGDGLQEDVYTSYPSDGATPDFSGTLTRSS